MDELDFKNIDLKDIDFSGEQSKAQFEIEESPKPEAEVKEEPIKDVPAAEEKPTPDKAEVNEPQPNSFKDITGGQFEDPKDLWGKYQELLKEKETIQAPKDPLSEDEKWQKFREAYEAGVLEDYLKISSVDYEQMSDEQILRMNLAREYEGLPEDKVKRAVDIEMREKYGYGEDEDEVDELKQLKMIRDAKKVRSELIKKQQEFEIPKRNATQNQPASADPRIKEVADYITSSPVTKELFENKRLQVRYGDSDPYNFEVKDTEGIVRLLNGEKSFIDAVAKSDGGYDLDRLYKGLAYMLDPEGFEKALIGYGKNLGTDGVLDVIENPSKPDAKDRPDPGEGDVLEQALKAWVR